MAPHHGLARLNAPPGSLVLDVAAGTGLVSRELAGRKLVHVVSLDVSGPMLRAGVPANREAGLDDRIRPVVGRAEALPFPDDTFDAVTFTYLLRYVDDPEAVMRELARVLRPGGGLAVAGVPRARATGAPRQVAAVHADRDARDRSARVAGMVPHRTVPGTEHRAVLPARSASRTGAVVAGGRDPARAVPRHVARRRRGRSGA